MNRITRASLTLAVLAVAALASLGAAATASAASAPAIESESVSHLTATDATIEAQISTGGTETTYEVWVGNYPECIEESMEACDSSSEHPIRGTIAGSSSPTTISIDVGTAWHQLSPSSEYIYNVDATNSNWAFEGSAYGPNKVFKTSPASPPTIESESVSHITQTDATLEAQINTEGLEATYEFQLRSPECSPPAQCIPIIRYPLPSGKLLGSFVTQSVSLDLNSAGVTLQPGKEYFYAVTATNPAGTTEGHIQTFTAPSEPATANAQTGDTGGQSQALQPPSSGSPSHHRRHRHRRRHPRREHRRTLHRAELPG